MLLTCGPGEEFQVESIINLVQGKRVARVQTGLQELGAITKGSSFVLCHNGGYMHMASVLGASVIALFGVVHPRVWKPLGQRDVVIYKGIQCSPCNESTRKAECYDGDAECKRVIEIEDVLEAIEQILNSE